MEDQKSLEIFSGLIDILFGGAIIMIIFMISLFMSIAIRLDKDRKDEE